MSKWKVLIADDEPMIRAGLKSSVDWSALDMEVKAEAEDGEEALEYALKFDVDLLLADLNMPIMNGIEVIRALKEKKPDCQVIIITGYDEFSYAQEAIRMNVTDYILKPVNPEQLKEVVAAVKEKLEAIKKESAQLKQMTIQLTKNKQMLKEAFGQSWIKGVLQEQEIINQLDFFHLPVYPPKEVGIVRCQAYQDGKPFFSEEDRQLMMFAVKNCLSEWLREENYLVFSDQEHIVFITWSCVAKETVDQMQEILQKHLKIHSRFYIEKSEAVLFNKIIACYNNCLERAVKDESASPIVRRAKMYIDEHFTEQTISLESTAEALKISPVYLSRVIKQELGLSFVQIITSKRIKKAMRLLSATDLTILEISETVGYESQHYFSTAFKKAAGKPPNQYRKHSR